MLKKSMRAVSLLLVVSFSLLNFNLPKAQAQSPTRHGSLD
jgi:hypothetical protein